MSAERPATRRRRRRRLSRDRAHAIVAGVCAGIARRAGVDPVLIRVGFVILVIATSGAALAAYAIAWVFMDEGPDDPAPGDLNPVERALGRIPVRNWRVAAGVGFLTLALLLVLREIGLWWSDAVIWPAILAASGAALLWRQSRKIEAAEPDAAAPVPEPTADRGDDPASTHAPAATGSRLAGVYSGGFGIALVLGAALLFLYANGALGRARDVVLGIVVAVLALSLILAPFLWRLGRNLAAERAERIRSQERAEVAAHLHDSVLQTLTLVQKRSSDPRAVASLARRQERELRAWLFDSTTRRNGDSLVAALEQASAEVEDAHAVAVELVAVGDRPMDERGAALVAAAREALTNSAKFAGDAASIAVYAEIDPERSQVFVRDRGAGFDPDTVPDDRRGVRDSIIGRMRRHGGEATIRSGPGGGTEVELTMPSVPS
jgi:phage shock protein PspC (stress-responsive transcriptional regulator)/anti-sigma regulatory factor (Ser/Thr protein kinase)